MTIYNNAANECKISCSINKELNCIVEITREALKYNACELVGIATAWYDVYEALYYCGMPF